MSLINRRTIRTRLLCAKLPWVLTVGHILQTYLSTFISSRQLSFINIKTRIFDFHRLSIVCVRSVTLPAILKQAVEDLVTAAKIFDRKKTLPEHQNSPYSIRTLNDQLMQLERAFLRRGDIKTQRNRHAIFSPMPSNSYYGSGFSGIVGAIDKLVFETSNGRKDAFPKELFVTVFAIRSAISVLSDPIDFIQNRDAGDVS